MIWIAKKVNCIRNYVTWNIFLYRILTAAAKNPEEKKIDTEQHTWNFHYIAMFFLLSCSPSWESQLEMFRFNFAEKILFTFHFNTWYSIICSIASLIIHWISFVFCFCFIPPLFVCRILHRVLFIRISAL